MVMRRLMKRRLMKRRLMKRRLMKRRLMKGPLEAHHAVPAAIGATMRGEMRR